MTIHFILFVKDQRISTEFYASVFNRHPHLNVPGMTEFKLGDSCILGLMPERGIKKLLSDKISDPAEARGAPRAELYLVRDDAQDLFERATKHGATNVSDFALRDWNHEVAYCLDPDGHLLAFAKSIVCINN
jgi:uncharacterized glyoxalase superfamily protein PhnB